MRVPALICAASCLSRKSIAPFAASYSRLIVRGKLVAQRSAVTNFDGLAGNEFALNNFHTNVNPFIDVANL